MHKYLRAYNKLLFILYLRAYNFKNLPVDNFFRTYVHILDYLRAYLPPCIFYRPIVSPLPA